MSTQPADSDRPFRFFDNREKYLLFVTTCGEKWAVAERIGREIEQIQPTPPALKLFDAGTGDGSVLASVLRDLHGRFPTVPFLAVGKEISLEDVRLTLGKLADRFSEHPETVVVMTNLHYREAPWLQPETPEKQAALNWQTVELEGHTAHDFDAQLYELGPRLRDWWEVRTSKRSGNPVYVQPSVLVIYRADQRFILDGVIPPKARFAANYDLVIAAQPYRARQSAEQKVRLVLEPLARSLAESGRMITIQATGQDPGMEIIRSVWPEEHPFQTPGPMLVRVLLERLAASAPGARYEADSDDQSLFRYGLHVMPTEVEEHIGTSTLLAAWNAAVYVAQIDDDQVSEAMTTSVYLDTTREVLARHGGLWFIDESFVIVRQPG